MPRLFLFIIFASILALLSYAPPVKAIDIWDGTTGAYRNSSGKVISGNCNKIGSCDFCDGIVVTRNIMDQILLPAASTLATGFVVYGALLLMVSHANKELIGRGKDAIKYALLGILIVLSSWIIINTVFHILTADPKTGKLKAPWDVIECKSPV